MIAILLATYNGAGYIKEQIDSILAQTYEDWVLYVHDDASMDQTPAILEEYAKKYPHRIKIVDGPATGCARDNFMYLTKEIEAPYYMYCDQDDVWKPDKIKKTWQAMQREKMRDTKPVLVFTELEVVDQNLNTLSATMSRYQGLDCNKTQINRLLMQNVVTGCTMMCNRCLRDLMLVDVDQNHVIMHDWWAALIAAEFGKIIFIKESTIKYRQHQDNSVGALEIHNAKYLAKRMKQGEKIRKSLALTRIQAAEFSKAFHLTADSLPAKYGQLMSKGKFSRLAFYVKNDMKKTTVVRNLGLVIFG